MYTLGPLIVERLIVECQLVLHLLQLTVVIQISRQVSHYVFLTHVLFDYQIDVCLV